MDKEKEADRQIGRQADRQSGRAIIKEPCPVEKPATEHTDHV